MAWDDEDNAIERLHGELADLESDADCLVAALEQLTTGAVIVSETLEVICLNRQAEALLARTDVLQVQSGVLVLREASLIAPLKEAIRAALARQSPSPSHMSPLLVSLPRAEHLPLSLLAVPVLPRDELRVGPEPHGRVMLLIYDPQTRPQVNTSLLEILFGLSPTEASIAGAIVEGQSLSEIALLRGCQESTIRSHLKSIFRKTHTHRQSDLVRLVLTSVAVR
jgi:DNA-binding CsgD family transcriptional regulator